MKLLIAALLTLELTSIIYAQTGNKMVDYGIAAGTELTQAIGNKQFATSMGKLATKVAPYLGMVGPLIGLIAVASGTHADSAELMYMREKFSQMDNRFDLVDLKLDEIGRKIDRMTLNIQFYNYESKIKAAKLKLDKLLKIRRISDFESIKSEFTTYCRYGYAESAQLLYDHIVFDRSVFSRNILLSAVKVSDHDRRSLQAFMLQLTKLILIGSQIDIAYYKIVYPGLLKSQERKWTNQINKMRKNMESIDSYIEENFLDAANEDAKEILSTYKGYTNSYVSDKVYDKLEEKYYWRNWFVAVYDDIKGRSEHWISLCNGKFVFREKGYNMLLASNSRETTDLDFSRARSYLNGAKIVDIGFWSKGYFDAIDVMESMEIPDGCSSQTAYGVIKQYASVSLRAHSWRYVEIWRYPYILFMFR